MKKYSIVYLSYSTARPLEYANTDSPADAVKIARKADSEGNRLVRILDLNDKYAMEIEAFAAKYRV